MSVVCCPDCETEQSYPSGTIGPLACKACGAAVPVPSIPLPSDARSFDEDHEETSWPEDDEPRLYGLIESLAKTLMVCGIIAVILDLVRRIMNIMTTAKEALLRPEPLLVGVAVVDALLLAIVGVIVVITCGNLIWLAVDAARNVHRSRQALERRKGRS